MTKEAPVTDKERDKNAARRLAIIRHAQEVAGNVAMAYRLNVEDLTGEAGRGLQNETPSTMSLTRTARPGGGSEPPTPW
jgi:hypothetical protein